MREILRKVNSDSQLLNGPRYPTDYNWRGYKWAEKRASERSDDLTRTLLEDNQLGHASKQVP